MEGKIIKAMGRYYTVSCGGRQISSVLRGRIKQDSRLKDFSEPAAVGDTVDYELDPNELGIISRIHERKNVFTRKDRGSKEDLIAANIDLAVAVQAFAHPKLNLRFADRLFVRARKEGLPALLCINKMDLAGRGDLDEVLRYYRAADLPVLAVCAADGRGMDELKEKISGKISLFLGSSGVGKSTVLNRLIPGLKLPTSEVSRSTGKGRHTTTNVQMLEVDENTCVIDTPGFREFGLMNIAPETLSSYFPDFREPAEACRFSSCTHDREPDCGVRRAADLGSISEGRYRSYLNILYSVREYHAGMYRNK